MDEMSLEDLDDFLDDHPQDAKKRPTHKIIKGLFGYPGGKARSVKHIIPLLPYSDVWVDVFGGSGVITLNREPSRVLDVYNDRWSGVVSFFRCLRDDDLMNQMLDQLELLPNSKEEFYLSKNWNIKNDVERAVRWYYMMSYSFGGMGRNWGRSTSTKMQSNRLKLKHFPMVQQRMMRCQIENADWREMFDSYDSYNTIFYCDPPYMDQHVGMYKHYFKEDEHIALLNTVMDAKGFVAVSSYTNELYNSYEWDNIYTWEVKSTIAPGKGTPSNHRVGYDTARESRTEVLYVKEVK
jgi:DNA adenine methylase